MKNKKSFLISILIILVIFSISSFLIIKKNTSKQVNTVLMLIEFERIEGILQWEKELDLRGLTALIKVQDNVLKENPEVFKRLSEKGYEIAGGYDEAAFWDMSYSEQLKHLKDSKELVEKITGKDMKVFGSRYFAYDENTLKASDELGIEYILGRGVNDIEAKIYKPEEYNVKVISVSNVDVGEPMGRGSLCDYSLWARGADAEEFGKVIDENLAKNPENMILVSHSYLGGTRVEWWEEYKRALSLKEIKWNGFEDWIKNQEIVSLPNGEIPINREVKYTTPSPAKEIEQYEAIPGMEYLEKLEFDDGTMCL